MFHVFLLDGEAANLAAAHYPRHHAARDDGVMAKAVACSEDFRDVMLAQ
jgi:hypothetical protein